MTVLYSVRDWDSHFEVAQTRKVERTARWVPLPVKHDGKTFRRLMGMENGIEIYGAWVLIVQVAAKCKPRGVLQDDQEPLTAEDIAIKTGAPERVIQAALRVLSNPRIGWLVVEQWEPTGSALPAKDDSQIDEKNTPANPVNSEDTAQMGARWERGGSALPLHERESTVHDSTIHDSTRERDASRPRSPVPASAVKIPPDNPVVNLYLKWYPNCLLTTVQREQLSIALSGDLIEAERCLEYCALNGVRSHRVGKMIEIFTKGDYKPTGNWNGKQTRESASQRNSRLLEEQFGSGEGTTGSNSPQSPRLLTSSTRKS